MRPVAVPSDGSRARRNCQQLIQTAVEQLGGVDILANIAGEQQNVPDIAKLTTEQFDETYRTNVYAISGGVPKEALKEFGAQAPLGHPGQPTEMAPAYVFLASQESSYVKGETLNANGGTPTPQRGPLQTRASSETLLDCVAELAASPQPGPT